ncbi:IS3 family transposase [Acidithiobacillus ferrivorans]|uniref:IS3 family transposase n=1 Tax=Acidithiobacillus ferrivorans TaxID=160808 RepID=A0A7T5BHQ5_9PROT|nr:IS3 family transposase [Acidithiobacillus ferrivorans]QQD73661.1 IS3 family transposase [Acidithiobacillus ferrivorans]
MKVAIRATHKKPGDHNGAKRLHKELQEEGFVTRRDRVVRLRQEMGIQYKQRTTLKSLRKRTMIPYLFIKDYSVPHQILL